MLVSASEVTMAQRVGTSPAFRQRRLEPSVVLAAATLALTMTAATAGGQVAQATVPRVCTVALRAHPARCSGLYCVQPCLAVGTRTGWRLLPWPISMATASPKSSPPATRSSTCGERTALSSGRPPSGTARPPARLMARRACGRHLSLVTSTETASSRSQWPEGSRARSESTFVSMTIGGSSARGGR